MRHFIHDQLAFSATLHCLSGCAIGELAGLIVGTGFNLPALQTFILAVGLAFVFGYGLSAASLLRHGLTLKIALGLVLAADSLSIATMELTDNLVVAVIPGAMNAGLGDILFWGSMAVSLIAAFITAYPVNHYLLTKGKGHALVHHYHHSQNQDHNHGG